jgi:predicted aldo/keto reductase-like oxidoreductase
MLPSGRYAGARRADEGTSDFVPTLDPRKVSTISHPWRLHIMPAGSRRSKIIPPCLPTQSGYAIFTISQGGEHMQRVILGKTGLRVSQVAFGGIPIQRVDDQEAVRVIRHCLDLGVNFLDTAYGYGTSEERIGRAIAGRREGLVLASKSPARDGKTFREHLDLSFQRLGVDRIDLYQFHNVSDRAAYEQILAPGGALDVAREAKAAGRIGHIGITSHSLEMALEMVPSGHFETLMFPFNFITDEPAERLLPLCEEHGVAFLSMKPMGGGMLENARLAFQFLRHYPAAIPVVGIEQQAEIDEIVSIMQSPAGLSDADRAEIKRLREELGTRFCRRCGYCQPCEQGVDISTVVNLRSFGKRFPRERMYGEWGETIVAKAEGCVECGVCESRCPYQLPIREIIRENVAWFRQEQARLG